MNRIGIINIPSRVPISNPPTAPVPIERFPAAPVPVANTNGNNPTIKAKEVIKIGRNLALAAPNAESTMEFPALRRCMANSTIKMAFLASVIMMFFANFDVFNTEESTKEESILYEPIRTLAPAILPGIIKEVKEGDLFDTPETEIEEATEEKDL